MSTWSGTYYVDDGDPPRDQPNTAPRSRSPTLKLQRSVDLLSGFAAAGYLRPPAARPDGAVSELRPAHGDASSRQAAAHLDRLQSPQAPVSVSGAAAFGVERSLSGPALARARRRRPRRPRDFAASRRARDRRPPARAARRRAREAERFLNPLLRDVLPDPAHLKDMDRAVARLVTAVERERDHRHLRRLRRRRRDLGGAAARFFAAAGARTMIYVPDRQREGYGPNAPALLRLKSRAPRSSSPSIAASPRTRRSRRRRTPGST